MSKNTKTSKFISAFVAFSKNKHLQNGISHKIIVRDSERVLTREQWHEIYRDQLIHIYYLIRSIVDKRHPNNKINWDTNPEIFHNLSFMLYQTSSGEITPFLEELKSDHIS